jgi:leader peptidase (prepilin peptidase)/N-methyltransferase
MVGVGFAGAMWVARFTPLLPAHLAFVMVTSILVVTDFDEKLIPNRVLFPGTAISAALLAAGAAVEGRLPDLGRGLAVAAGYVGLLFLVAVLARGGFGLGDVKLAALLGLFLGFWGWFVFARGLLLIGLFGGIPALVLIALRRAGRKDEFPYGPAMVFGAWAALAIGDIGGGVF